MARGEEQYGGKGGREGTSERGARLDIGAKIGREAESYLDRYGAAGKGAGNGP